MKHILSIIFILFMVTIANAIPSTIKKVESTPTSIIKTITESGVIDKIGLITINTNDCKNGSPCFVVANTSNNVLSAVNKGLAPTKTHNLIQSIVIPQFDFSLMTKFAMGNNWKLATPVQQKELVRLFQNLLIFTYSSALSGFRGAEISINSVSYRKSTASVMTKVLLPSTQNNQSISVEYDLAGTIVESQPTTWKAYDIKIENTSLVTTYRTQFNDIIQSNKVDGLIKQLQNKVSNLKSKGDN